MPSETEDQLAREETFHDEWASSTPVDKVMVRPAFESFVAMENRLCLELMSPLAGKRVLDLGTGLGEAAVYFALQGAQVTAVDVSPAMIETASRVAAHHGVAIEGIVSPLEQLELPAESFDVVYGANVLHHVSEIEATLARVEQALVPGGLCVFWDPIAYNPVINVYRRLATEVRSEDEAPLKFSVLKIFRRYFADVRHREFWLLTLSLFLKYYLIDRKHPNEVRYWKSILEERPETTGRWFGPLSRLDGFLLRIPPLNRLAWNTVIWARKA
jgi:2-polyprenyl-3-methyl-5-hydroxy-6-metoxy-1,4-benzoquinol methylase